jgi:hypothetical protein
VEFNDFRQRVSPALRGDEFTSEGQRLASSHRSAVNRAESRELD